MNRAPFGKLITFSNFVVYLSGAIHTAVARIDKHTPVPYFVFAFIFYCIIECGRSYGNRDVNAMKQYTATIKNKVLNALSQ